jgi:hypothetical protein
VTSFGEDELGNLFVIDLDGGRVLVLIDDFATPLPAALPFFATGLAGLGFITYRRRRRRAA